MRVVIVEDSVLLREGLGRILVEFGEEIVATLGDATQLLPTVAAVDPDVVIADVRMPPTHTDEGLRAAVALRAARPGTPVLVLSQYVEEHYARELLGGDISGLGYLLKERVADVGDFVSALRQVASGGTVLDPEVVSQLLARRGPAPVAGLSPREKDVLALMAQGRSNSGIAHELVVSPGAVEKHISSIFNRLDLAPSDTAHRRVLAVLAWLQAS